MKKLFKGKVGTVLILTVTVLLAGVAVFTAIRLYQLGSQSVAPNAPASCPLANGVTGTACTINFTAGTVVPTPTATPTPTLTLPPTLKCNGGCTTSPDNCPSGLACTEVPAPCPTDAENCPFNVTNLCRNPSCTDSANCVCPGTPTASPTVAPTATPTPTAPPSGAPNSCGGTCGSDANCLSGYYFCYQGYCRDRSCPDRTDCTCPGTPVPTASPRLAAAPTTAALPSSGTDWPTIVGAGVGVFVIIGSLLLAL